MGAAELRERRLELVCPAGTPAALRSAVTAGADAVYCGFRNETNARNFPGLNFTTAELSDAVVYAHDHSAKVLVAINTFMRAGATKLWYQAAEDAIAAGADALIVADLGLLAWAARTFPHQRLHLSVQAAAATAPAIRHYVERFGIKRVVLPRVLTVAEIAAIAADVPCETEVFVFGGLCVMAEGRCLLSSYATGQSPNMHGVCSPASHVRYIEGRDGTLTAKLAGFTINRAPPDRPVGYPTLCKGQFRANDNVAHVFEESVSLNAFAVLPELLQAGVSALKIEGRQRGRAYLTATVRSFRDALDALRDGKALLPQALDSMTEGGSETVGAYGRTWR